MAILIAVRPFFREREREREPQVVAQTTAITARSVPRDILSTNPLMIYRRKSGR